MTNKHMKWMTCDEREDLIKNWKEEGGVTIEVGTVFKVKGNKFDSFCGGKIPLFLVIDAVNILTSAKGAYPSVQISYQIKENDNWIKVTRTEKINIFDKRTGMIGEIRDKVFPSEFGLYSFLSDTEVFGRTRDGFVLKFEEKAMKNYQTIIESILVSPRANDYDES